MDRGTAPPKRNKYKNVFKCLVAGCPSTTRTDTVKLHSFPYLDADRAKKWIDAIGRPELGAKPPRVLRRLRVCDRHFDKKVRRGKNNRLWDPTAVPTLALPRTTSHTNRARRPNKLKMEKGNGTNGLFELDLKPLQTIRVEKDISQTNGDHEPGPPTALPGELQMMLSFRRKLQQKNKTRKGFDKNLLVFALNLYLSSPSAYRVIRKTLCLPNPALLLKVDVGIGTRFDTNLVKCFESKIKNLGVADRECVLCIDEIELSKNLFYAIDKDEIVGFEEIGGVLRRAAASRALVLCARAASGLWTQPLGYFYLADDTDPKTIVAPLKKIIIQTLHNKLKCKVIAIISALGPTFAELARALDVTVESPYVIRATSRRRVFFLYDLEQIFLTLRDTLMTYDIKFVDTIGGDVLRASWRDVEALYRVDQGRVLRLVPELTRARVFPTPHECLEVSHALALFSRRVAAHMAVGAGAGADAKNVGTVRLLRMMADLRAALAAPPARRIARATAAIDEVSHALCRMTVVSRDGDEHDAEVFVHSLQVSLAGALHVLVERAEEEGAAPLRLARCGLRPLRRVIERIEREEGRVVPRRFRSLFRRWTMRHLVRPIKARGVRPDDLQDLLRQAEDESLWKLEGASRRSVALGGRVDHRVELSRARSPEQAAARLLAQCRRAHSCAAFVRWARHPEPFARMVRSMDGIFKKTFASSMLNAVGRLALPALAAFLSNRAEPCACFPRDLLCRLFVRCRIRGALRAYNASYRQDPPAPGGSAWLF